MLYVLPFTCVGIYINVQGVSEYAQCRQYVHIDFWLSLQLPLGPKWSIPLHPTPRSVENIISLQVRYCERYSSFRFESEAVYCLMFSETVFVPKKNYHEKRCLVVKN
jgi:hypothetical protein